MGFAVLVYINPLTGISISFYPLFKEQLYVIQKVLLLAQQKKGSRVTSPTVNLLQSFPLN
jgi:hypothetical protein